MTGSNRLARRDFLCGSVLAGVAASLGPSAVAEQGKQNLPWRVGVAAADITPPLEVGVLMSTGRRLWQPFESVRLPLQARAVVIENANRRVALVALDLLGLGDEAVDGMQQFKKRVTTAADQVVGPDKLVLCSTHTHSAPASLGCTDLYRTEPFAGWLSELARKIGSAVKEAAGSVRPCRFAVGTGSAPGHAINRRTKTTQGIRAYRVTIPAEIIIGPEGPTDESVHVAAFFDRSDQPVAVLVGATCHPIHEMCSSAVSADFPGEMCLELEKRFGGCMPLFFNGAAGNVNPPLVRGGPDDSRRHGRQLAEVVAQTMDRLEPVEGDELVLHWRLVEMPARQTADRPLPEPLKTRIGALRLAEAAFCFIPGEPFIETALAIRRASPWKFTVVVGYAEEWIGYVPTDRAFDNGGYETNPGRWSQLARGSEPILRREAIELVHSLKTLQ